MKKISCYMLLTACLISAMACSKSKTTDSLEAREQKEIVISDSIFDFGHFPSSKPVQTHSFSFKNKGNKPIVVLSANASCKCTSVSYSKEPVRSGERGTITVTFDGKEAEKGFFNKSVSVRFSNMKSVTFRIKGFME